MNCHIFVNLCGLKQILQAKFLKVKVICLNIILVNLSVSATTVGVIVCVTNQCDSSVGSIF